MRMHFNYFVVLGWSALSKPGALNNEKQRNSAAASLILIYVSIPRYFCAFQISGLILSRALVVLDTKQLVDLYGLDHVLLCKNVAILTRRF